MVRILANGDIVQDDDPRVGQNGRRDYENTTPSVQTEDDVPGDTSEGFYNTMPDEMSSTIPVPQQYYQQQQQRQQPQPLTLPLTLQLPLPLPQQQRLPQLQQQLQQQRQGAMPEEPSPLLEINQQLVNMGFPVWYLGNQLVEPVMSILLVFVLLSVGIRGLFLIGFIYIISRLSDQ